MMTAEEAVQVLNWHRHNDDGGWSLWEGVVISSGVDNQPRFTPFEAIAIAEKYERDSERSDE